MQRESPIFGPAFATFLTLCVILLCALVSFAGNDFEVTKAADVRVEGAGVRPQLFFACELDTPSLQSLIADPAIIANLKDVNGGVALALNDLSPARARIVRELNQASIPMVAWIVLPMKQGYYLNAYNASDADRQFTAFEKWTADHGLKWVAVGLDMEPNFNEFSDARTHRLRLAATFLRRSFNGAGVQRAGKHIRHSFAEFRPTVMLPRPIRCSFLPTNAESTRPCWSGFLELSTLRRMRPGGRKKCRRSGRRTTKKF